MTDIPYTLIRSDRRKTLSIQVQKDLSVVVRAPKRTTKAKIETFVESRRAWIADSRDYVRRLMQTPMRREFTEEEFAELKRQAREIIIPLVEFWSSRMGVEPQAITFTKAETRFGSCSGKNRISFSCRLILYPPDAVEYVVVHELAHIRHHNHSPAFYQFVAQFLPDYRAREALLKQV